MLTVFGAALFFACSVLHGGIICDKMVKNREVLNMNKEWEMVLDFQKKFGHPYAEKPVMMEPERAKKRYAWMLEEINEFLEADEIVEQADAMIDVMYFALGTLVEMGIEPDRLFEIVHEANMTKLWPDGKPHFNEMGKTIKPSTWEDPHPKLEEEINRQYAEKAGNEDENNSLI